MLHSPFCCQKFLLETKFQREQIFYSEIEDPQFLLSSNVFLFVFQCCDESWIGIFRSKVVVNLGCDQNKRRNRLSCIRKTGNKSAEKWFFNDLYPFILHQPILSFPSSISFRVCRSAPPKGLILQTQTRV